MQIKSLFDVIDKVDDLPPAPIPKMKAATIMRGGKRIQISVPRGNKK